MISCGIKIKLLQIWPANILLIFQVGVFLLMIVAFFFLKSEGVFFFRNVSIFPGFFKGICWKVQNSFSHEQNAN